MTAEVTDFRARVRTIGGERWQVSKSRSTDGSCQILVTVNGAALLLNAQTLGDNWETRAEELLEAVSQILEDDCDPEG